MGPGSGQTQFGHQPVLEGSGGALHTPLRLGRPAEDHLDHQFSHGSAELGEPRREAGSRRVLEHSVAIGVESHGHAATLHQGPDQQEIVVGVLLLTEPGAHRRAGGIVHSDQQRERWGVVAQPRVMAAVHLDQHSLPGHPLPTDPVFGRSAGPGTAQPSVQQDPSQGGPADVDALPFRQQFREVGVVDASVPRTSQVRHVGDWRLGRGVDRSATAVAMCQSRRTVFTVGRQNASGVAGSYSHQLGCLVQGHMLFCQAVQNLQSVLLFWGQCHILHDVTAMMGPGHLDQGLTLDGTFSLDVDRMTGVDLTRIDGIDGFTALKVIREIGTDMTKWPSAKHFASWLGLSPNNRITGGKVISSKTKASANRAAAALRLAANALHRSDSALGAFLRRKKAHLGAPKAITATAHKLTRLIYSMLRYGQEYVDAGAEYYETQHQQRALRSAKRRAAQLGYQLVPMVNDHASAPPHGVEVAA